MRQEEQIPNFARNDNVRVFPARRQAFVRAPGNLKPGETYDR